MKAIRIIVVSPENLIKTFLKRHLPAGDFEVISCKPGAEFIDKVKHIQIAVIDRINDRRENAQREISLLKEIQPKIPIIAVSEHSTYQDATVVQQGVFYYMAGYSEQKLIRIIRAAVDSIPEYEEEKKNIK